MNADAGGGHGALPDREHRDLISEELDRNILVEAAAGTGKTTSMVGRMLALLRAGKCSHVRHMAAVTFTRKAAAELRSRFQVELEKAVREAEGDERDNLEEALTHVEQCFIGTIHSFCARLLRERPVEAGVDVSFSELDEDADKRLREEAWDEYAARLIAGDHRGILEELDHLGLSLSDLEEAFLDFAGFPDVEEWPEPGDDLDAVELDRGRERLLEYASHMWDLAPRLPADHGNDKLIPRFKRLPRVLSHCDELDQPEQLIEVLELFDRKATVVLKVWERGRGLGKEDARRELDRWNGFRSEVVKPLLGAWRRRRYRTVMRAMHQAREIYDEMRRERGSLNFQDLLMKAAELLRENAGVRRYFGRRFTHVLVDEFQDTDPIQAEVLLLLTSSDTGERDWRRCRPRPGSLFVVGDPKQSIYRFRRADIVTYNETKGIIRRGGEGEEGLILELKTNFRSTPPVLEWVNRVFEPGEGQEAEGGEMLRFGASETEESPAYVPLLAGMEGVGSDRLSGPLGLRVPGDCSKDRQAIEYEAGLIARFIRDALDSGMRIQRTPRQLEERKSEEVDPRDFMIITPRKRSLAVYARELRKYGIPHRVTGGSALNDVIELELLHTCLTAVIHPHNPVALVAALRSELFGISDRDLYSFKREGGHFSYLSKPPPTLPGETAEALEDCFERLRRYRRWLSSMPPVPALESMADDLGLMAMAAGRPGGDVEAGSLAKAFELLREAQRDTWTTAQLVDYLGRLVEAGETHDGISARSEDRPEVRIMNLHKAKGLEAPVVFLADPTGEYDHEVTRHIDRAGDRILGYMAIYGKSRGWGRGKLLAHPDEWEARSEGEKRFLRAEALRLRYVAATRSGTAIVITQREKGNSRNPWRYFEEHLPDGADLPDPGPQSLPGEELEALLPRDAATAREEISARLEKARGKTYEVLGAKQYALSLPPDPAYSPPHIDEGMRAASGIAEGEHGVEWGSAIHLLLQLAMDSPRADLEKAASAILAENDLDPALAGEAAATARTVMGSSIWERALGGDARFTEVPFQLLQEGGDAEVPLLLRGAVDLAFREDGGWVLVDYKTDSPRSGEVEALARRYTPQLRLYADAWERITSEPVKELDLYFVRADLLVTL